MKKIFSLQYALVLLLLTSLGCKEQKSKTVKASVPQVYSTDVDFNRTVMQILDQSPKYNSFLKLVNAAAYFDEIGELENIMVFVPTDEAFGPNKELINELSKPENLSRLTEILKYHFVQSELDADNIFSVLDASGEPLRLQTLTGGYIAISLKEGRLQILDEKTGISYIDRSSIRGTNGIVFTIDRILRPREQR